MRMRPGFVRVKRRGISAKQRRKLVVKDFYDLLARGDTTHNLLAQRLFLDASNKVLCDPEVDIRFQQMPCALRAGHPRHFAR